MAKDVQEMERAVPERAPGDEWKGLVVKLLKEPKWKTRDAHMPMLSNPMDVAREWEIKFGGVTDRRMKHFAFETRPGSLIQFVGVTVPEHRPKAWLIYFRHTAQRKHFEGDLLELGAGDYLIGRFQVAAQIAASGRSVGAIIPVGHQAAGQGEFATNQGFATQAIAQIEANIYGSSTPNIPLLAASYSDGIFSLGAFLSHCPALRGRLKAIYDFDGSYHLAAAGIGLAVTGVRTFRYDGAQSPTASAVQKFPSDEAFLRTVMLTNPARVPLALSRWRWHRQFKEIRPYDDPKRRLKKGDDSLEAKNKFDKDWLHHRIPTCMLHHGLISTGTI
jgi:hypothetical protein